jgi:hypothetical protein
MAGNEGPTPAPDRNDLTGQTEGESQPIVAPAPWDLQVPCVWLAIPPYRLRLQGALRTGVHPEALGHGALGHALRRQWIGQHIPDPRCRLL